MKLLVVAQKVDINDDNLGSFHGWLEKLSGLADLCVIANSVGKHDLPDNVKVFSLGKEKGAGRFLKILKYQWFLLKMIPGSDGVFFHMCPEYVIGAGLWPKIFGKKTLLWYTHKSVNFKLKLAEKLVDKIFTASRESFRLASKKAEVTGHGIDMGKFKNQNPKRKSGELRILTAGRITPVKNYELLIEAAEILKGGKKNNDDRGLDFKIRIAGKPVLKQDEGYFKKLKDMIEKKGLSDKIKFVGSIPNRDMAEFYQSGDLFVNFSDTGSLDKAVLEAMACGLMVLTSNEAFRTILSDKYFADNDYQDIARKIIRLSGENADAGLREYVAGSHNVENLAKKIINFLKQ